MPSGPEGTAMAMAMALDRRKVVRRRGGRWVKNCIFGGGVVLGLGLLGV